MAVGIFDSGLGGLTVLDAVTRRLPDLPFVYFGDNAHAPYGVRDGRRHLPADHHRRVERLFDAGCDLVILACNTASRRGAAPDAGDLGAQGQARPRRLRPADRGADRAALGRQLPPARGRGEARRALRHARRRSRSRAFQRELAFRAIGVDVEAQACGGVVDAIEEGDMILAEALVRTHVDALRRKMPEPDAAVLGCTHYPLVEEVFQDALGPEVKVFSQPDLVADEPCRLPAAGTRDAGRGDGADVPDHRRSAPGLGPGDPVPPTKDRVPCRMRRGATCPSRGAMR